MKTELVLKNDLSAIPLMEEFVSRAGAAAGVSPERIDMLVLAVEEAVTNVINYAYGDREGDIVLTAGRQGDSLVFEIKDQGEPFDPTQVSGPDVTLPASEREPGGLGLFLIRKIMDGVHYRREGDMNVLTLTKQLE